MAGPADLTAIIDADIKGLQSELRRGREDLRRFERETIGNLDRINKAFENFARIGSTVRDALRLLTAAAPIVALNQLTTATANAVGQLRELGDTAQRLYVSTDFLQVFRLLGENAGASASQVDSALRSFGQALTELKAGSGSLKDTLGGVNDQLLAQLKTVQSVEQGVRVAADAIAALSTPTERARLAVQLFGEENIALSRALSRGSAGLEEFLREAQRTGQIIDSSVIARAREMEIQFQSLSRALDTQFKQVLIDLAPLLLRIAELSSNLSSAIKGVVNTISTLLSFFESDLSVLSLDKLKEREFALAYELAGVNAEIDKLKNSGDVSSAASKSLQNLETRAESLRAKLEAVRNALQPKFEEEAQLKAVASSLPPPKSSLSIGGGVDQREGALRALADLQRKFLTETRQTRALIEFEYEQELKKFNELLAKKTISNEEFERARQQLAAISSAKLAEAMLKEVQPIADAIRSNLENAFSSFIQTGKVDFKSLTNSILADLAKVAFRLAVLQPLLGGGAGGGGGVIGNLLSGVFHEGGVVGEGGPLRAVHPAVFAGARRYHTGGIAGLRPNEVPAILERGEMVIPKDRAARAGAPSIVFNVTTPDADSFRRSEGQITAMLARAAARGQRVM